MLNYLLKPPSSVFTLMPPTSYSKPFTAPSGVRQLLFTYLFILHLRVFPVYEHILPHFFAFVNTFFENFLKSFFVRYLRKCSHHIFSTESIPKTHNAFSRHFFTKTQSESKFCCLFASFSLKILTLLYSVEKALARSKAARQSAFKE